MSWVKRNLYFLIGSVVAVVLLGLAGYYFYSRWQLNNQTLDKLNKAYSDLENLKKARPNPGNDETNNIVIASQQETQALAIIERERKYFSPIAPIPNPTNNVVTKEEFASALPRTIDELKNDAAVASVTLPKDYSFSFEAERRLTIFAPGSLEPLSEKLGEIKEICHVLYQAKVNSLDNLRRERVSADDQRGPQSDYLEIGSVTNRLAVMTPYEIVFHCFSPELARVLGGFANSPHNFVVKAINVEPGVLATATETAGGAPGMALPGMPAPSMPAPRRSGGALGCGEDDPPPAVAFPGTMAPAAPTVTVTRGGLPVLVDEKQLKVTLELDLIKLLPKK